MAHPSLHLLHRLGNLLHIHLRSHGEEDQANELQAALEASEAEHPESAAPEVDLNVAPVDVQAGHSAEGGAVSTEGLSMDVRPHPAELAQQLGAAIADAAPAHPLGGEADAPPPPPPNPAAAG